MTKPLVVVLDDPLIRTSATTFRGDSQLTAGLRELLDDPEFSTELWCREWVGTLGHDSEVQGDVTLRYLPRWTRLSVLWVLPQLLMAARRISRRDGPILSVGPSFSQLSMLLMQPRRAKVTWLVRSDPAESLVLTREASNALVRLAIRAFCSLWRVLIRRQDDVVCVSAAVAREVGIDGATVAPEIGWEELEQSARGTHGQRRNALYVGRLSPEKGPDLAVDAFLGLSERCASASLTLVGTGEMEARLRSRAEPLGDRVRFVGAQSRDDLTDLMAGAAIVLAPSRSEGFGLAAFEAAASGAIVLHSDVGGLNEACGWWPSSIALPRDDASAWARALEDALLGSDTTRPMTPDQIKSVTNWPSIRHVLRERARD